MGDYTLEELDHFNQSTTANGLERPNNQIFKTILVYKLKHIL